MGKIEKVEDPKDTNALIFRVPLMAQPDEQGLNRQATWFHFSMELKMGPQGWNERKNPPFEREVTLIFCNFDGCYDGKVTHPSWKNAEPVFTQDPERKDGLVIWEHFRKEELSWNEEARTLTVRFTPKAQKTTIAYTIPYVNQDFLELLADTGQSSRVRHEYFGTSLAGFPMEAFTITDFSVPDEQKRHFFLMARQHAWEAHTSWQLDGLIRFLSGTSKNVVRFDAQTHQKICEKNSDFLTLPDLVGEVTEKPEFQKIVCEISKKWRGKESELAEELCRKCVFHVVPIVDWDGVHFGRVRFNGNGFDVNRRWNEVDLRSEVSKKLRPECWFVKKRILELNAAHPLTLIVNLYGDTATDYCDACGPEKSFDSFRIFENLMAETGYYDPLPKKPVSIITDPATAPPTTFSLWWDERIPVLMIEQKVCRNRKLDRCPTISDSQNRGAWLAILLERTFR